MHRRDRTLNRGRIGLAVVVEGSRDADARECGERGRGYHDALGMEVEVPHLREQCALHELAEEGRRRAGATNEKSGSRLEIAAR